MPNRSSAALFRAVTPAAIVRQARGRCIVVVAPHPDDETLGCGALIAHAAGSGCRIAVVALTDGDASHPGSTRWPPARLGNLRAGELRRAIARLAAKRAAIRRLGWPDGTVATAASATRLSRALVALNPAVILVTSVADHHPDHRAAAQLVSRVGAILGVPVVDYAVWSRVDRGARRPSRFTGVKRWALAAHRSQLGGYVVDSPAGFCLAPAVIHALVARPEVLTRMPPRRRPGNCSR